MSKYLTKLIRENAGLAWKFQVNPISCGNSNHYEQYIKLCALPDQKEGRGTTHLLIDKDDLTGEEKIMGFVTLKASSLVKIYDDYEEGHSALEITELAVDINYEKQGVGTYLLDVSVNTALDIRECYVGIEYITLCADPLVVSFYAKFGFAKLEDYYSLPREGWNRSCTPMLMRLPSQQ